MGSLRVEQVGLVVSPRHNIGRAPRSPHTPLPQGTQRRPPETGVLFPETVLGTPAGQQGTRGFCHRNPRVVIGTPTVLLGTPSLLPGTPPLLPGTPPFRGTPLLFPGTPPLFPGSPIVLSGTPSLHRGSPNTFPKSPSLLPGTSSLLPRTPTTPRPLPRPPKFFQKTPVLIPATRDVLTETPASFLVTPASFLETPAVFPRTPPSLPPPKTLPIRRRKWSQTHARRPCSIQALLLEGGPGTVTHEDISNIELIKLLGCGGFGSVYKGLMRGMHVAVKYLHLKPRNPAAQSESYRAELHTLTLSHPHVVAGLCAAPAGRHHGPVLVMEYVSDRNLLHIINDVTQTLDVTRRLKYGYQLSEALTYIHSRCVVHLDVKPSNILLTVDDSIKLGDFGCCQVVGQDADHGVITPTGRSNLTGTVAYRAPELLRGEVPSRSADIYAVGVTLWQLLSRQHPYGTEHQHVVVFGVVAYNLRPALPVLGLEEWWEGVDAELHPLEGLYVEVVAQCWDSDREMRPPANILRDVFETWIWGY